MVQKVPYSVLEETESLGRYCHIRTPHEESGLEQTVFRKLRCGSQSEYYHLDKVFWREREHGFSLPSHKLVRDTDANPWLQVEHVDGVSGDELMGALDENEVLDNFLISYANILESVIRQPGEPFHTDQRLEQYMYDGENFLVTDLEPRVGYFDEDPDFRSVANRRFLNATSSLVDTVIDLHEKGFEVGKSAEKTYQVASHLLSSDQYFKPYPGFEDVEDSSVTLRRVP